jgi:hypothetical protein
MSRTFSANSDHLDCTAVHTTYPYTVSLWAKAGSIAGTQYYFTRGVGGTSDNFTGIRVSASQLQAIIRDTTNSSANATPAAPSTGAWELYTATFRNDTNRAAFINGANKGTAAVAKTLTAPDALRISGTLLATPTSFLQSGALVAHVGLWNIELADADILNLATKAPNLVQAANLIEYWPLTGNQSPEPSSGSQATNFTVTGASYSTDNPIIDLGAAAPIRRKQRIFTTTYYPR